MKKFGSFVVRHRRLVALSWLVLFVVMMGAAQSVGSAYSDSFSLPGTDSTKAYNLLGQAFGKSAQGDQDQIVYRTSSGTLADQSALIEANLATVALLPGVAKVTSPFPCPASIYPALNLHPAVACSMMGQVSHLDPTIGYATVSFVKPGYKIPLKQIAAVIAEGKTIRSATLEVEFGGNAFGQEGQKSGSPGEMFGIIAAAVVLLLAFGSFFAMLLPLGVAIFSLGIASAATILLSHGIGIASFAPILGSLIGLGVGIDYALFIVTRARQSIKKGHSPEEATVSAINTSGRAVIFAAITVCIALLGLLVLRLGYLNGVAIAATVTVAITMFASVTLLPALLGFMGMKVLSRKERRALATTGPTDEASSGAWLRWAQFTQRRGRVLAPVALAVMVVLAIPYFSLNLGSADQGTNPKGTTTRAAYDLLATGFGPGFAGPLQIVGTEKVGSDALVAADEKHIVRDVKMLPGVAAAFPSPTTAHLPDGTPVYEVTVIPSYSPQDPKTKTLINDIRTKVIAAGHYNAHVGGLTAIFADFASVLGSKLPLFIGVIVLLGCLLLMLAFRSILVPLTAALMNLLAAAASFGVVVAVFQWGWGSNLIGAGTGPIEAFLPTIMIAILFGLSMDYQVFLVSRMHEEWVHTGDNAQAVTRGQASTGRVITAAALIMICVFLSFVFGGQRVIAEFGIGLGGAVLLDAFILRTILVPALMHILGKANWWLPQSIDKVLPHLAVEIDE